jgi:hypothetical protein
MRTLAIFPSPDSEDPALRVFRAWRYWESNVCGATVAGIGAAVLFSVVGGILLWGAQGRQGRLWGAGLILYAIAAILALLPGNVAAVFPYAVEIEEGKSLRFYAPFKKICVPIEDVKRVKWSWLWAGWVVRLKKRRRLLTGFIIHVAWGRTGRELARAIEEELARRA